MNSWQPIETAPKCVGSHDRDNGRRPVIVTRHPACGIPPFAIARLTRAGWISGKRHSKLWFEPTHWMKLPAPPTAEPRSTTALKVLLSGYTGDTK